VERSTLNITGLETNCDLLGQAKVGQSPALEPLSLDPAAGRHRPQRVTPARAPREQIETLDLSVRQPLPLPDSVDRSEQTAELRRPARLTH
jgi:hypothetical protein